MMEQIPFLPIPHKKAKKLLRGFYPLSTRILKFFPSMKNDLDLIESKVGSKDYVSGALLSFTIYFTIILLLMGAIAQRLDGALTLETRMLIIGLALVLPVSIFLYAMVLPHWLITTRTRRIEKNLLFATRHLMIQTTAGVPLFDAIVSVSEEYGDEKLDYGEISKEFKKIVAEVRTGKDLTEAFEKSASDNASLYYRKVIWQLANANRAGSNIGNVLKNLVEYLSAEQRILIQDYGSQLNPLALFYMIICIIAPTMGLIFIMVTSSFVKVRLTEWTFVGVLLTLIIVQIMFMGFIKSRRPRVAI